MPDIRHAITLEAPPDRVTRLVKRKDAAERGGPPRPLFTKSGLETLTPDGC